MNTGKCPKCGNIITSVKVEPMSVTFNLIPEWKGVSYVCSSCSSILGVEIDPISLKHDIVVELLAALKR